MTRIERLANNAPWLFALLITVTFILMAFACAMIGALWPGSEPYGRYIGGILGRIIFIAILLAVLYRLHWLQPSGFTRPGRWQTWLLIPLPLVYAAAVSAFAMTGAMNFRPGEPALTALAALFIFVAAFFEEVAFRGLILHNFMRAWGTDNQGPRRAVVASAIFFGAMHLANLLGGSPLPEGLLQTVVAFFLGILLAALVLSGGSIYPAFVFHGLFNWTGYLNQSAVSFESAPSSWLLLSVLMIPLAILGLFIIRGLPRRSIALDAV